MIDRTNPALLRSLAAALAAVLGGGALAAVLVLASGRGAPHAAAQGATLLRAALSGSAEVPPVATDAVGEAVLALEADGTTLHFVVTVDGLADITAAHLHLGTANIAGPPFAFLYDATGAEAPGGTFDAQHPISGTLALSSTHALALLAGGVYVNVHTAAHAGGEIRGQVAPYDAPERTFAIGLGGDQEVPPIATEMTGIATFTLGAGADGLNLGYRVSVSGDGTIGAAHIHRGERGANGAPIHFLYDRTGANGPGGEFGEGHPISGTLLLSPEELLDVLAGSTYVNVHTADHPGGEVRGQLVTAGTALPGQELGLLRADLRGSHEVPPITTTVASGSAVMAMDVDGVSLHYVVAVSDIADITAAHLHVGQEGANGPPIVFLYDATGANGPGGAFGPGDPLRGTVTLNPTQAGQLLDGGIYLNVHTTANPGGEIRGQVLPYAAEALTTTLTGAQEVPPVETAASGMLRVRPSGAAGMLAYRLSVTDIVSATAAHLHRGRAGTNGPVVATLFEPSVHGALAPGSPVTGEVAASALLLVDLYGGNLYANVHTAAHPGGEVRGQLAMRASTGAPTATPTPTPAVTTTVTATPETTETPTPIDTPDTPGTPTETGTPTVETPATPGTPGTPADTATPTATSTRGTPGTPGTPGTATATAMATAPGTREPTPSATSGAPGEGGRIYLPWLLKPRR